MGYFTLIYNPARNPPWLKEAEAGFEVIVKEIDTYQNNLSEVSEVAQSGPPLCDHLVYSLPGFSIHGILQGIFPTQGLNLNFLHWRQTL